MKFTFTSFLKTIIVPALSLALWSSCSPPRLVLKEKVHFDTLNLQLDLRLIQDFEYRQAIEAKVLKFVQVYNTEEHPFRLSLYKEATPANCSITFLRARFVSRQQSHLAAGVTAAGVATAAVLISSKFFIPVGWVYIPNAKTTLQPELSSQITDVTDFPKITVVSTGMYRSKEKQTELQSNKVLKYIIQIVQHLEQEYKK